MGKKTISVQRWQSHSAPAEEQIQEKLRGEGLQPYRWSNAPGDVYEVHSHSYAKVIYVVNGSIEFHFPDEHARIAMNPGDRVEIVGGLQHSARVGAQGVVCLEAHRDE